MLTIHFIVLLAMAGVADLYTTFRGMKLGLMESNPMLGQSGKRIAAVKLLVFGMVLWVVRDSLYLPPSSPYRLALIFGIVVWAAAATWNWRLYQKAKRRGR